MVGYALSAQYPDRVTRWVVIDAPLARNRRLDNIVRSRCCGTSISGALTRASGAGRERIYLDRFWNELSGDPKRIDEDTRQHYAAYTHGACDARRFEQFGALRQDAADNKALLAKAARSLRRCWPSVPKSFR